MFPHMTDTPPEPTRAVVVRASDFAPVTVIEVSAPCFYFLQLHPLDNLRFLLTDLPPQLRPNPPGRLQAQGSLDSAPHLSSCYSEIVSFNGRFEVQLVLRDAIAADLLRFVPYGSEGCVEHTSFRRAWLAALEGTTAGNRVR